MDSGPGSKNNLIITNRTYQIVLRRIVKNAQVGHLKKDYEGLEKVPELGYNTRMTCIVGISDGDLVYIGGDRAASDGDTILSIKNPKVYSSNDWVYGYAGTIGIGQLISAITLPPPSEVNIYNYIRFDLVEQLRKAIDAFSNSPTEHDTSWLIGADGRLFELSAEDWGVVEVDQTSIGSGSQYALGSLYTSIDKDPVDRIGLALGAAIAYSPMCQGPIDILFA